MSCLSLGGDCVLNEGLSVIIGYQCASKFLEVKTNNTDNEHDRLKPSINRRNEFSNKIIAAKSEAC